MNDLEDLDKKAKEKLSQLTPEMIRKEGELLGFIVLIPKGGIVEILRPSTLQDWEGYESFEIITKDTTEFDKYVNVCIRKAKKNIIPLSLRFKILKRDDFKCQYCGKSVKDGAILEVDHIIPKSKSGTDNADNLITSCRECNRGKSINPLNK